MADTPGKASTIHSADHVRDMGYRRCANVAVLQCGLRAEVEIVGDERGGGDVLWSGIALLVTVTTGCHWRKV